MKEEGLPNNRNVNVIKLSYKKKGDISLLYNYRPILINADVRIRDLIDIANMDKDTVALSFLIRRRHLTE